MPRAIPFSVQPESPSVSYVVTEEFVKSTRSRRPL
jgi:hypothetical protein